MKWEKQQRRKAERTLFLMDLRNETVDEALMLTNPFISRLLIHAWALRKRKGLWPKTFIFHSYSSPELCRWMGPFGDLESLARARWMGLWTFTRPQQQQSDVSLFERAFFFKNVA